MSQMCISFIFKGNDKESVQLLAAIVQEGIAVKAFQEEKFDVEDVFMQVSKGEVS